MQEANDHRDHQPRHTPGDLTLLIEQAQDGRIDAQRKLFAEVYNELKVIAASFMRSERPEHTLGATALVNESYLRLFGVNTSANQMSYEHRHAFFKAAAVAMRRILIDHARAKGSVKRAPADGKRIIRLDIEHAVEHGNPADLIALDEALDTLTLEDELAASHKIPERFKDAPVAEAAISAKMGDQFRMMNDFERAESQLTRSLELSKQLPDLPPETLAYRYINLIDLYTDIDDLDRALALAAELDAYAESTPELPHTSRIDMLVQHASIKYYQRELESAAEIFEQAVQIGENHAPDHTGTIDAIGALAMVYTNLSRYEDAAPLHLRNIQISKASLGPDNPGTLQSMDNHAIQLYRNNQPEQARELLEQVLEIRLRVFGPDHHKTNLTRALIGRTTYMSGDHAAAEPILLDAYDRLTQTLGEDHRYTLTCRNIIKLMYEDWNKPELAANYAPPNE